MLRSQAQMVRMAMAALMTLTSPIALSAAPTLTINDHVYSLAQALRGQQAYSKDCASCHMSDMQGNGQWIPALAGDSFMMTWNGKTVADLFHFIQSAMPQMAPHSLTPQTYIDIVAYILSANGLPAGKTDLRPDVSRLQGIKFVDVSGDN